MVVGAAEVSVSTLKASWGPILNALCFLRRDNSAWFVMDSVDGHDSRKQSYCHNLARARLVLSNVLGRLYWLCIDTDKVTPARLTLTMSIATVGFAVDIDNATVERSIDRYTVCLFLRW